ncbi:MAG: hypothetical protein ABJG68_12270 [Crocinitomicaceae bacterium]
MTRKDICKVCLNHEKDRDFGIICGLTYDKPSFRGSCPDFIHDPEIEIPSNFQNNVSEYDISTDSFSSSPAYKPGNRKNKIIGKKLMTAALITIVFAAGLMYLSYNESIEKEIGGVGILILIVGVIILVIGFIMFASANNRFETEEDQYEDQEIE